MKAMRSRCAGIHVGLDLEDEAGELAPRPGRPCARAPSRASGPGALRGECRQQLLDAEVVDRRAEEHRRLPAGAIGLEVEGLRLRPAPARSPRRRLAAWSPRNSRAASLCSPSMVTVLPDPAALAGGVGVDAVLEQVVDAAQLAAHADRPGHRGRCGSAARSRSRPELDRRAAVAVELVDEGHDRRVAQAAHLHELDGALLHALGAVDDHERGVHRGQGAVGVLGEVLVAGGVEQIDDAVPVTGTA